MNFSPYELIEHIQAVLDSRALGQTLQREPVVEACPGTWRAMTQEEALAVLRLVGEAIGERYAEDLLLVER